MGADECVIDSRSEWTLGRGLECLQPVLGNVVLLIFNHLRDDPFRVGQRHVIRDNLRLQDDSAESSPLRNAAVKHPSI